MGWPKKMCTYFFPIAQLRFPFFFFFPRFNPLELVLFRSAYTFLGHSVHAKATSRWCACPEGCEEDWDREHRRKEVALSLEEEEQNRGGGLWLEVKENLTLWNIFYWRHSGDRDNLSTLQNVTGCPTSSDKGSG